MKRLMNYRQILVMMTIPWLLSSGALAQQPPSWFAQPVRTPELRAEEDQVRQNLQQLGYVDKSYMAPRARFVADRIAERRAKAQRQGLAHSPEALGFYTLESLTPEAVGKLPFVPTMVPEEFINSARLDNYLLLGGHRLKQMYHDTPFGTLLVDEFPNTQSRLEAPNREVAGEPATLLHLKHQGADWATALYVQKGDRLFLFEADQRLEGHQADEFLRMAEAVLMESIK
ncbi:MAG: hypothetical protein Tsb002_25810 [Wenzhouxiangellaceae bacterium]